jgi:glycosyltransferase involved in cell wall biosynthesis
MRILHIINGLSVGGAEMMLYKLLATMDRQRFVPVVIALTGQGPLTARIAELGVPVVSVGFSLGVSAPRAAQRFRRAVRRLRVDLVQGWQYYGNLAAGLAQLWLPRRVPVVWNIRHSITDLADEKRMTVAAVKLGARLCHRTERIIYAARTSAQQHEALGYRADKRIVLPNGFDTQRFAPSDEARRRLRHDLGLAPSTLLIGKIARYHPMKDHAGFLQAAHQLAPAQPDVHFVLAGDGVDRSNAALRRLIEAYGLAGRVHLLGRRDDVQDVVAGLDVLTSAAAYGEAFPNVLGEAMACGVPCVATDVGDSALVVGAYGCVTPPRQPEALATAWTSLIEMGEDGRMALGLAGRRHVVEQYALPSIAARYEALYDEIGRAAAGPGHPLEEARACVGSQGS